EDEILAIQVLDDLPVSVSHRGEDIDELHFRRESNVIILGTRKTSGEKRSGGRAQEVASRQRAEHGKPVDAAEMTLVSKTSEFLLELNQILFLPRAAIVKSTNAPCCRFSDNLGQFLLRRSSHQLRTTEVLE